MVLLTRHAERTPVTDIRTSAAAMLTEQGRTDALLYGRMLASHFGEVALWHSPVPRCETTAVLLAGGAGRGTHVAGCLPWLGGDFIGGDPDLINSEMSVHGHGGFLRRWFSGDYSPTDIAPLARCAALELKHALRQIQGIRSGVIVDVTHDWNLMFLREAYMALRHEDVGTPPYLDSVAILERQDQLAIWSLGRTVPLSASTVEAATLT